MHEFIVFCRRKFAISSPDEFLVMRIVCDFKMQFFLQFELGPIRLLVVLRDLFLLRCACALFSESDNNKSSLLPV